MKKILSETTRPRALIFGMMYYLEVFYQVCLNYTSGAKNGPTPGVTCSVMIYIGLNREKHEKIIILSETIRHRAMIFGM